MKLQKLEVRNFRSINELTSDEAIIFNGLDCLVGMNNAGKSNILEAISYLLGEEDLEDYHYPNCDTSLSLDVRGFFEIDPGDLENLGDEDREELEGKLIGENKLGICRRCDKESELEIIALYPTDERLSQEHFNNFHNEAWKGTEKKGEFKEDMIKEFPELIPFLTEGKESNKGEWPDAYDRFVENPPENVSFSLQPAVPSTSLKSIISGLLPDVMFVPAVKEMDEAAKTSWRGEFGALLDKLSAEIQEELDETIDEAILLVKRKLNVEIDPETGKAVDERHPGVQAIEKRITSYLSETFQDFSVSLNFPSPTSIEMFRNAEIKIKEKGQDPLPTDSVGEGVQRVLIFSLFRTLADLRQGKLSVQSDDDAHDENKNSKPLLILYEEAELFLHPGLQKILLLALNTLIESGDQVIFTTHSPFMIQDDLLDTINLVTKDQETGTQIVDVYTILHDWSKKDSSRLLQMQNISSYIFANRVLLVEGLSDRLVLKKLAPALNPYWSFDKSGIPILQVGGKGDLPLFKSFLESLGILVYVVTDIDSIRTTVSKLSSNDEIDEVKGKLLERAEELAKTEEFETRVNKRYVEKLVDGYQWSKVFKNLRDLYIALIDDDVITEEQIGCLEKLLLKTETDAEKEVWRSDHDDIQKLRLQLAELLMEENVLLLCGDIEDYYPDGSSTAKVKSALEFNPGDYEREEICSCFSPLQNSTDVEKFLTRVFSS